MLQQERDTRLAITEAVGHFDFVCVGDVTHQIRETLSRLARTQVSLIWRCQLHNGDDITTTRAGVPALDQFAGAISCLSLFVDFLGKLLFRCLQLPEDL